MGINILLNTGKKILNNTGGVILLNTHKDFSRTSETGTFEIMSETIGALIAREWDLANTVISPGGVAEPKFIYDENKRFPQNITAMQPAIIFTEGSTFPVRERSAQVLDLISVGESIFIEVNAPSQLQRRNYEFEIWRILRKFRPSATGTFILKSNETDNSSIHDYDEIMPEFVTIEDDGVGRAMSSKSIGILSLISEWVYS